MKKFSLPNANVSPPLCALEQVPEDRFLPPFR